MITLFETNATRRVSVGMWLSDGWYEMVMGNKRYEYVTLTFRKAEGFDIVSFVFFWLKVSIFVTAQA